VRPAGSRPLERLNLLFEARYSAGIHLRIAERPALRSHFPPPLAPRIQLSGAVANSPWMPIGCARTTPTLPSKPPSTAGAPSPPVRLRYPAPACAPLSERTAQACSPCAVIICSEPFCPAERSDAS